MNDIYNQLHGPMSQFWVVDTARGKYLMTWSLTFSYMWGYSRCIKELPR